MKVLLVDDDESVLQAGQMLMEHLGHSVQCVTSGLEGLQVLQQKQDFDLVVLDYSMPDMSGQETLNEIRKTFDKLPVVICSGYIAGDQKTHGSGNCAPSAYLRKPFHVKEMQELIGKFNRA